MPEDRNNTELPDWIRHRLVLTGGKCGTPHQARAALRDPDRLRSLVWPRPEGGTFGWVAVAHLPSPAARQLRLFGTACVRELWHLLTDADRAAVLASERVADGLEPLESLKAVSRPLSIGSPGLSQFVSDSVGWAVLGFHGRHPAIDPDNFHMWFPFDAACSAARALAKEAGRQEVFTETRARQAAFLLDLVSPFPNRTTAAPREWLTSTVLALSRVIYHENTFDLLPILADALQDAGCNDDRILDHCRGPGPHVRGCWVVDLVLGKE